MQVLGAETSLSNRCVIKRSSNHVACMGTVVVATAAAAKVEMRRWRVEWWCSRCSHRSCLAAILEFITSDRLGRLATRPAIVHLCMALFARENMAWWRLPRGQGHVTWWCVDWDVTSLIFAARGDEMWTDVTLYKAHKYPFRGLHYVNILTANWAAGELHF